MSVLPAGPAIGATSVLLRVPDPERGLSGVQLHQGVERPRDGPAFAWREEETAWVLEFPRRGLARLEYRLEREWRDGRREIGLDPRNPCTAPGSFGPRSAIEFPGYEAPDWLDGEPPEAGSEADVSLRSRLLATEVPATVWTSPGQDARTPLPLLIVHDGREYAHHASLLRLLARRVADGTLPPHRAALLTAADRSETYAASPLYARALVEELLPALDQIAPVPPERHALLGLGASLGALQLLVAHRLHPGVLGGLALQSGSFFHLHSDRHEGSFPRYRRIKGFVEDLLRGRGPRDPIPVAMTVGRMEESRPANLAVRDALAYQGYDVALHEGTDVHNWTAWRDLLDPHLVRLLRERWTGSSPSPPP